MILILSSNINIYSLASFNASSTAFYVKFPNIIFNKGAFIIFVIVIKLFNAIIGITPLIYI